MPAGMHKKSRRGLFQTSQKVECGHANQPQRAGAESVQCAKAFIALASPTRNNTGFNSTREARFLNASIAGGAPMHGFAKPMRGIGEIISKASSKASSKSIGQGNASLFPSTPLPSSRQKQQNFKREGCGCETEEFTIALHGECEGSKPEALTFVGVVLDAL